MSVPALPPNTPLFHKLWSEQSGCCALCGDPMPKHRFAVAHATIWKKTRPTFDHIIPRAAGGSDHEHNLRLAHANCNKRRGCKMDSPQPR
ncbi:MAG: HNH endonuclease signature motif containing protein [Pseudomonadota bacterium]